MIFSSHIHAYYTGYWGQTPFIITGGAGAELIGVDPQHDFYHYIKVNVTPSHVEYELVKLSTPPFNIWDRVLYDAWIYIYVIFSAYFWDIIIGISILHLLYYIVFINKKWLRWNIKK